MVFFQRIKVVLIFSLAFHISLLVFATVLPAQGKTYCIGPRDVIALTIYAGGEKQQQIHLTVSSEGMINVPFIGPVNADGLTIAQLQPLIQKPLAKNYFVNPQIILLIKGYHSLQYYISGAVSSPGLYEMASEATLMKLIATAGGVSPQRGNVAYILRASADQMAAGKAINKLLTHKEPVKVDLKKLLDKGDMSHNLILKSGDVVYIPLQKALNLGESKIYVEGQVKSPGVYNYQDGLTVLNACIMAGGFGKFAAPNRAKIVRKNGHKQVIIKVDLNDIKKGKANDIELEPGDRIHVPETWL